MTRKAHKKKVVRLSMVAVLAGGVVAVQRPAFSSIQNFYEQHFVINSPASEAKYGHWDVLSIPGRDKINTVHANVLFNGDVLLMAGSGNNAGMFAAGTFKSLLLNPKTMQMKEIPTPADLFCDGHVQLPDGNVLMAGGTKRYEVLGSAIKNAGGAMQVKNESPNFSLNLPKGAVFYAPDGAPYKSELPIHVPAATKRTYRGGAKVTASETEVWVDAAAPGKAGVIDLPEQYRIKGLTGAQVNNVYGLGDPMTLNKQDFQGMKNAYIFNVRTERYQRVEDMAYARWYPTLLEVSTGMIMAMSGLDGTGVILNGQNEFFNPTTLSWSTAPTRYFPTYPWVTQTDVRNGALFYSGSNAGFGPATRGRVPGFWNLKTNVFTPVPGIEDPNLLETSNSVLLAPAQAQRVMVIGGGGIGESPRSTARTALINLKSPDPTWTSGPDLAHKTRYPSAVLLPTDDVFITGGSSGYRGKHNSDNRDARIYHPTTNTLSWAAAPLTGRDYHSEGILLPSGQVLSAGGNPLYLDKKDTISGADSFNQVITVYSPPYLFSHLPKPAITSGPAVMVRGGTYTVHLASAVPIGKVRLIHPASVTHMTDVSQRSVAVGFRQHGRRLVLTVDSSVNLLPPGWFMLFATSKAGIPSQAFWVQVTGGKVNRPVEIAGADLIDPTAVSLPPTTSTTMPANMPGMRMR